MIQSSKNNFTIIAASLAIHTLEENTIIISANLAERCSLVVYITGQCYERICYISSRTMSK